MFLNADPQYTGMILREIVARRTTSRISFSVSSPFSLGGGFGAWSLSARYSNLDLNWREGGANACVAFAQCIRGGEQNVLNIGLNWYLNSNLKLVTEYAMVGIDRRTNGADNLLTTAVENSLDADFDIVQGRLQFTF